MCLKPRDTTTDKAKSKGLTARHQAGRVDSEIPGLWPPGWSCGLRDPRPVATRLVVWAQRSQACGHQAGRMGSENPALWPPGWSLWTQPG